MPGLIILMLILSFVFAWGLGTILGKLFPPSVEEVAKREAYEKFFLERSRSGDFLNRNDSYNGPSSSCFC